jgi:hypothetical protein
MTLGPGPSYYRMGTASFGQLALLLEYISHYLSNHAAWESVRIPVSLVLANLNLPTARPALFNLKLLPLSQCQRPRMPVTRNLDDYCRH